MKPRVNADEPIIPDFIVDPDAKNFLKLRGAEKIVKENKRLLGKMQLILDKPSEKMKEINERINNWPHRTTLNSEQRYRNLKDTTNKNSKFLQRLREIQTNYNFHKFDQQFAQNQDYAKMIKQNSTRYIKSPFFVKCPSDKDLMIQKKTLTSYENFNPNPLERIMSEANMRRTFNNSKKSSNDDFQQQINYFETYDIENNRVTSTAETDHERAQSAAAVFGFQMRPQTSPLQTMSSVGTLGERNGGMSRQNLREFVTVQRINKQGQVKGFKVEKPRTPKEMYIKPRKVVTYKQRLSKYV